MTASPLARTLRQRLPLVLALALALVFAVSAPTGANPTDASPRDAAAQDTATPTTAPQDDGTAPITEQELDQMLAPIALYPDELLSQVLMASTYPLEIIEASRFAKANPELEGAALTAELEKQDWDPSVKSLVNFPDVLESLDTKLEWTRKIGDAFLADQKAVLDNIQKLRRKAKEAGNLESSDEMTVTSEESVDVTAAAPATETIVIKAAKPEVVYVPVYDPLVVYGTWWWPLYPPPVYYRPPYYRSGIVVTFGVGCAMGAAWGYAWGGCNWGRHDVDIDINRNININGDINRGNYKNEVNIGGNGGDKGTWKHDPEHRKGVEYRDRATASKFEGVSRHDAQQSREAFRGRASADRSALSRARTEGRIDASGRARPQTRQPNRPATRPETPRTRPGSTTRPTSRPAPRPTSRTTGRSGAFTGSRAPTTHSTTRASSRGRASRGASRAPMTRGGRRR